MRISEIEGFSPREMTDNLSDVRDHLNEILAKVQTEVDCKRKEMDRIWNDLYDIAIYEDIRRLSERITVILRSGIPDSDHEDYESTDHFLESFMQDVAPQRVAYAARGTVIGSSSAGIR